MLVEVAEDVGAVPAQRRAAQVVAEHGHGSGGGHVETREDPEQRRLARTARAEDDDDFAGLHAHRQPLQRDRAAVAVDAKDIVRLDGGHASLRAVAAFTSRTAASVNATPPSTSTGQSSATTSGGNGVVAPAVTATTDETSETRIAPVATPPAMPAPAMSAARTRR